MGFRCETNFDYVIPFRCNQLALKGKILFIFASAMMFALRFCSHWIENKLKLSPVAILFVCSLFAIAGLFFASGVNGITAAFGAMFIVAWARARGASLAVHDRAAFAKIAEQAKASLA